MVHYKVFLIGLCAFSIFSACRSRGKREPADPVNVQPTSTIPPSDSVPTEINRQGESWLYGYDFPPEDLAGEAGVINSLVGVWGSSVWEYYTFNERQIPSRQGYVISKAGPVGLAMLLYENAPLGIFPPDPQVRYSPTRCIFNDERAWTGIRVSKDLGAIKAEFQGHRLLEFYSDSSAAPASSDKADRIQIIVSDVQQRLMYQNMARDNKMVTIDPHLRTATTAPQRLPVAEILQTKKEPGRSPYYLTASACPQ